MLAMYIENYDPGVDDETRQVQYQALQEGPGKRITPSFGISSPSL